MIPLAIIQLALQTISEGFRFFSTEQGQELLKRMIENGDKTQVVWDQFWKDLTNRVKLEGS